MKKIHYISIMICIITCSLVWCYHIVQDNKKLKKHEQCMKANNYFYTQKNCKYCDSFILKH